jgi:hypothetical protein
MGQRAGTIAGKPRSPGQSPIGRRRNLEDMMGNQQQGGGQFDKNRQQGDQSQHRPDDPNRNKQQEQRGGQGQPGEQRQRDDKSGGQQGGNDRQR